MQVGVVEILLVLVEAVAAVVMASTVMSQLPQPVIIRQTLEFMVVVVALVLEQEEDMAAAAAAAIHSSSSNRRTLTTIILAGAVVGRLLLRMFQQQGVQVAVMEVLLVATTLW
jgi:hypothetical protein